jgi:23S rRNA (guanosine2251-2'-O)-methyltransferase
MEKKLIKKSARRAASKKSDTRDKKSSSSRREEGKKAPKEFQPKKRDTWKKDYDKKPSNNASSQPTAAAEDTGMVIGVNPVQALFADASRPVEYLAVAKGAGGKRIQDIVDKARAQGLRTRFVDRQTLDGMSGGLAHQGVIARAGIRKQPTFKQIIAKVIGNPKALLVLLDGVEDPHNLGAIIRSAESFGAIAVILPKDRSAALSAVAAKASAGAVERLDVVRVTNLTRSIDELKENGVHVIGLAGEEAQNIKKASLKGAVALVMGGEGKGLRRLTRDHCDSLVSIPITGGVGSLNVSVAAGVALYEVQRSRGE